MHKFVLLTLLSFSAFAAMKDDALLARNEVLAAMKGFNPSAILRDFNANPSQSNLELDKLNQSAQIEISKDPKAQEIYQEAAQSHTASSTTIDPELIDKANEAPRDLGCAAGQCDDTADEPNTDLNEGLVQLGTLGANAEEVGNKQVGPQNPSIFAGSNHQCRIAVAGIGNCCGGHARFLSCRPEEKNLSIAITEHRAYQIGKYCAHYKAGICWEEKESWCVFQNKLASIVQIEGRLKQLGISLGTAKRRTNAPNCRGITPEELARIQFRELNLSPLTEDFKSKVVLPNPQLEAQMNEAHIEALRREGKAHD